MPSNELSAQRKLQYQVFLGLSAAVLALTGLIYFTGNQPFERFIGGLNPLMAGAFIILAGFLAFASLLSRGWFAVYRKGNLKGLYLSAGLAAIFGIIIILVDSKLRFPVDLNISFPGSLLFYPAIGFFVEILFHVLPLTLILVALTSLFRSVHHENILWFSIFLVAVLEPVYQAVITDSSRHFPPWVAPGIGVHVFLINLVQLTLFKRYDFITMYAFRLVYYLFWHIGWGYFRLQLLF